METEMIEEWKLIPNWGDKYEVSNFGRVRTLPAPGKDRPNKIRIRKNVLDKRGYYSVMLCHKYDKKLCAVHRLVAEAFVEKTDGRSVVHHIDSNPKNNKADNLKWVTTKENVRYKVQADRHARGEMYNRSKLTDDKVKIVRYLAGIGWKHREIAEEFGVSASNIGMVVQKKTWAHV